MVKGTNCGLQGWLVDKTVQKDKLTRRIQGVEEMEPVRTNDNRFIRMNLMAG